MSQWCRLWDDMPTDPKFRVVAKRAGRPVSEVLAVFVHMMANATNAPERGELSGWHDEAVAIAIDAETEHVEAIRLAMQGMVLDNKHLTAWEKRQPLREDGSAERAKAWRLAKKSEGQGEGTHPNAPERTRTPEQSRVEEIREDTSTTLNAGAHALDDLEAKLREAADLGISPNPSLCDLSPIRGLIDAGYGLDEDILPVLRAKRSPRVRSWGYFVEAIREAKARRNATASAPIPIFDRLPNQRAPPQRRDPVLAALEIVAEKYR